jgi:hypothetical protein
MSTTNPGGTSGTNWIDGKYNYMESVAAGKTVYGAQVSSGFYGGSKSFVSIGDPTWLFLYNALVAGKDIELGIIPVSGGIGHAITLSSFNWTDANDDGIIQSAESATIDFIDPALPGSTSAVSISQTTAGGRLNIGYGGGYSLVLAISETAVPLPAAALAGMALLGAIGMFSRVRSRRGDPAFGPASAN